MENTELFDKHLEAIEKQQDVYDSDTSLLTNDSNKQLAQKSVEITLGYMKGLLEFIKENNFDSSDKGWYDYTQDVESDIKFYSDDQLIDQFLTSKK